MNPTPSLIVAIPLICATAAFSLGLLFCLYRIAHAPGVSDRILALDTMVINVIALIVLYGMWLGSQVYFEASILIAMVGFVSTVAYCRFALRGDIIE
ncbi:monovalent cation/proton antiporter, MnhF/PhaF family subunit [Oceaniovalibus guishaninsula JLT2003]|uniref:Monovalent cation/proton antiporter, MnhF/PhaF family subunit n=1 Tax=Oceaniovalibus guishaninsula JLT2003 TaxID=1231392 RepID=K2GP71_9RHOB|nr:K+/H+ antiporter subunit F [Oceaniovalibus guishaninsula]EKE44491.1 monovalent cation/proton antiporter, MnhF/PhaF family subunit [Oceaniovalibus guishaninsula JLT2003]